MLKSWNHCITTRNYAVAYYWNLEEFPWDLGQIKIKNCQKAWKNSSSSLCKIV